MWSTNFRGHVVDKILHGLHQPLVTGGVIWWWLMYSHDDDLWRGYFRKPLAWFLLHSSTSEFVGVIYLGQLWWVANANRRMKQWHPCLKACCAKGNSTIFMPRRRIKIPWYLSLSAPSPLSAPTSTSASQWVKIPQPAFPCQYRLNIQTLVWIQPSY